MDVKDLLSLVKRAANGEDDLRQGAVGFYGYGFVFRDFRHSNEPYIVLDRSSKVCGVGAYRGIGEKALQIYRIKNLDELTRYDVRYDCLFGGALKTLLPMLEFGGDESLFEVWMFVKTPDGSQFPATFYFGAFGTALGGWHSKEWHSKEYSKVFPEFFVQIIDGSPFDFTKNELEGLIEALQCALKKVPVSDFYGIYYHDFGGTLMGVKAGIPFIIELGYEYDEIDVEFYLEEVEEFDDVYSRLRREI